MASIELSLSSKEDKITHRSEVLIRFVPFHGWKDMSLLSCSLLFPVSHTTPEYLLEYTDNTDALCQSDNTL